MDEGAISGALDRIETALDRVESAALAPADDRAVRELEDRHGKLKASVEEALRRIDTLIGDEPA